MNIAKQRFKHYLSIHKRSNQFYLINTLIPNKKFAIKTINMIILKDSKRFEMIWNIFLDIYIFSIWHILIIDI
jgi:hypothetical protein